MKWIIEKWDWIVYRASYASIRRMCERDPGMAYLFFLWVQGWLEKHPPTPEVKRATEWFYESNIKRGE